MTISQTQTATAWGDPLIRSDQAILLAVLEA